MAVSLTHTTVAVGTDAGNGEIAKLEWNEEHALTMSSGFILGRTTASTGAVEELPAAAVRTFLGSVAVVQKEVVGAWVQPSAVVNGDFLGRLNVAYGFTITKVTTKCVSGSCTLTVKINTTALGGTANSVSTTQQEQTHSSANVAVAGDDITFTISATASCVGLTVEIEGTRTLESG